MSILYGGRDPRDVPIYSVATAAYLLGLSPSTLQKWVSGRPSRARGGKNISVPSLIERPEESSQLSFINLIEAHILSVIRRRHGVSLANVRKAIVAVRQLVPNSRHPLAELKFETDGVDLFISAALDADLVNASRGGQMAWRELIESHLQRVERDDRGLPIRLFPFSTARGGASAEQLSSEPREVVIDPRISFGKPVLLGTGIPTYTIASRYKAGENPEDLADDYGLETQQILNAVRYELRLRAA